MDSTTDRESFGSVCTPTAVHYLRSNDLTRRDSRFVQIIRCHTSVADHRDHQAREISNLLSFEPQNDSVPSSASLVRYGVVAICATFDAHDLPQVQSHIEMLSKKSSLLWYVVLISSFGVLWFRTVHLSAI